ncbi:mannose-1-phosphate guanyltransferase [Dictyobacter alpinus]|uniref:Mannose-1-phosphate guanyltransferase n=1 Tax=Dictyobacter alpinus TaxID=2014873 RepID=A0A402BHI0_9CHLR|nr:ABC transporter permease [Dictyobacter alpinus]GCE30796.1 mannose-1-phosphate guanyltransferase [Dictyobacter alpinus]
MSRPGYHLRVIWACMKKDIQVSLTDRIFIILGVFLPVNFLILFSLFVISGGQAPTAIVMNDSGPYAQQFYHAMAGAHSFVLQKATSSEARNLLQTGHIVAVVTIPADFETRIQHNQPVKVSVDINNLNTDFTNDIRRAVPLAITSFYAKAFPDIVTIVPHETDQYTQDTDYIPYLTVSILVIALVVGGLLQSGTSAAREWENTTMKELLLSPASRWAIITGKMLAALVVSLISVMVVLGVLIFIIGVHPLHWGAMIGFTLLILAIFIALGTLLGTFLRQRQAFTGLAIGIAIPLFFVSGAFGPISFNTPILQVLAQLTPVYYAIVLQQYAFHGFILNTYGLVTNTLILFGFAIGLLLLSGLVLHRSTVAN